MLQALVRDLAIGHHLDEIADDPLSSIHPHRRMLYGNAICYVANTGLSRCVGVISRTPIVSRPLVGCRLADESLSSSSPPPASGCGVVDSSAASSSGTAIAGLLGPIGVRLP